MIEEPIVEMRATTFVLLNRMMNSYNLRQLEQIPTVLHSNWSTKEGGAAVSVAKFKVAMDSRVLTEKMMIRCSTNQLSKSNALGQNSGFPLLLNLNT